MSPDQHAEEIGIDRIKYPEPAVRPRTLPHPIPDCALCDAVSTGFLRHPDDPDHVEAVCADHRAALRREGWYR